MATRIALALLCTVTSFTPPTPHKAPLIKLRKTRGAGGDLVDPDAGAPDDDAMTELRERMMQEELKQRKQTIKEGKGNRLSAQYVELLTAQHPSELVGAFYREADPRVQVAIQDAIMGMLGAGAVDIEFTTTGSRIAELCFRLQMTGLFPVSFFSLTRDRLDAVDVSLSTQVICCGTRSTSWRCRTF